MKNFSFLLQRGLRRPLLVGALVLCVFLQHTLAQSLGTWDFLLSGHRTGTAYITFSDDGTNKTFSGVEVMVPNRPSSQSTQGRNSGGAIGRGGSGSGSPALTAPQIFGAEPINGVWNFDNKQRVIGYFIEVSALESCSTNGFPLTNTFSLPYTNTVPPSPSTNFDNLCGESTFTVIGFPVSTNIEGSVTNYVEQDGCFTNIVVCQAITNAISFVGTINSAGTRMTLKCTTPFGSTVYKGVPSNDELTDITGNYYAIRKQNGVTYNEFLSLTNLGSNLYSVILNGPGYSYEGISLLSSQNKISFGLGRVPTLPTEEVTVVRATSGPFNIKKQSASTTGWDQTQGTFTNPERFDIYHLP